MKNYTAANSYRQASASPELRAAWLRALFPALFRPRTRACSAALLATASLALLPASARAADADKEEIQLLRQQIELLSQKIEKLEKRQVMADADEAKAIATTPKVSLDGKGFVVSSPDKAFSIKLGALVQTDARVYIDGKQTSSKDGFLMRRVRTPISGTVFKTFSFNITPELSGNDKDGSNTKLFDAWVQASLTPEFNLKFGKFKTPVSLEGPDNRHFIESSFTNQLLPNRDIGIEASGAIADGWVAYRIGVFNGAVNNDWSGVTLNTDSHLTLAGRLTVSPFKKQANLLSGLDFSIGASYGSELSTSPAIKTSGQQNIAGTNYSASGDHFRLAPAISWFPGKPYSAIAEFALDSNERASDGATITNTAWRVSGGYVLTGEKATLRGVSPAKPFSWTDGTWGAFEVVGRVSGLDLDSDYTSAPSGAFSYGVGLHWYFNDNIQARFGLEKTNFSDAPSSLENELYFFSRLQLLF